MINGAKKSLVKIRCQLRTGLELGYSLGYRAEVCELSEKVSANTVDGELFGFENVVQGVAASFTWADNKNQIVEGEKPKCTTELITAKFAFASDCHSYQSNSHSWILIMSWLRRARPRCSMAWRSFFDRWMSSYPFSSYLIKWTLCFYEPICTNMGFYRSKKSRTQRAHLVRSVMLNRESGNRFS